jgi:hypothetical protein
LLKLGWIYLDLIQLLFLEIHILYLTLIYIVDGQKAVPDKSADQICNLLIDEIFPHHGQVLELCSDNGTENINYKVKETLESYTG